MLKKQISTLYYKYENKEAFHKKNKENTMHTINSFELTPIPNVYTQSFVQFEVIPVELENTKVYLKEGTLISGAYYEHSVIEIDGIHGYANVYIYHVEKSIYGDGYVFGYQCDLVNAADDYKDAFRSAVIDFVSSIQ